MQNNVKFVTDESVKYRLGGNEWYAIMEDDNKVMLVDTDCKIDNEKLWALWSDNYWESEEGENGQRILDYTNSIANTYFSNIKHAIEPRTVEAGTGKLEDAYMWPMSYEEFECNKVVGGKIVENSNNHVWTRTFSGTGCSVSNVWTRKLSGILHNKNCRYAWVVSNINGDLGNSIVSNVDCVAPAFYLKKSEVDHISGDGEIVLKPADTGITN